MSSAAAFVCVRRSLSQEPKPFSGAEAFLRSRSLGEGSGEGVGKFLILIDALIERHSLQNSPTLKGTSHFPLPTSHFQPLSLPPRAINKHITSLLRPHQNNILNGNVLRSGSHIINSISHIR